MKDRLPLDRLPNPSNLPINASQVKRDMSEAEMEQLRRDVGERLKMAFDTDSYSEIGRQLDIPSVANVKTYVDGLRFPSPEVLIRFAARGFSVHWLMTGEGSMRKPPTKLFSSEDEESILVLARINNVSFWEQVEILTRSGLKFLEEIDSWKND